MKEAIPVIISFLLTDSPVEVPVNPEANIAPTVSISAPAANSNVLFGETLLVEALASDADGTVASVSLSVDGSLVRTENVSPYNWDARDTALQGLSLGAHQLTAVAIDNEGLSKSTTITFNVVDSQADFQLDSSDWTLSANAGANDVYLAIDGIDATRWTTGAVQTSGQEFIIDLGSAQAFDRLVLDTTQSANDYPRQYAVAVSDDGNDWSNVASGFGSSDSPTVIDFSDQNAAQIRITQLGSATANWWSIHELSLYANSSDIQDPGPGTGECTVSSGNQQWHRVELICDGPSGNEGNDSTFTDNRFDVTFTQGGSAFTVPGHFAADGNAAESGSTSGTTWRAYFSPPSIGTWNYSVSFKTGNDIAVGSDAGTAVAGVDGSTGTFSVASSTADTKDMRSRGLLQHRSGERYLRFAGDESVFIQGGMDSPENIFGFSGFDNTTKGSGGSCKGILHDFTSHQADWNAGDPSWDGGRGTALIGLINYIASHSVNSIYIMMNTVKGDGCDAHPWATYNSSGDIKSFDVSKLDQWEIALEHMTRNGIMIHAMTQETENDQLLNGGDLGLERKLYYRELISRFGHHPALQWNLGEENTNTTAQRKAYSDYIKAMDAYDHPIKMHTFPGQQSQYTGLLGHPTFDGTTMQVSGISTNSSATGSGVYGLATQWLDNSEEAGRPWVVTFTEASGGNAPTPYDSVTSRQRVYWMWASVMSGGGGFEWYLKNAGAGHAYDLAVEDLREFDQYWQQSGYLVNFFRNTLQADYGIDPQTMNQDNSVTSTTTDWVLSNPGEAYLLYLREGSTSNINLPDSKNYTVLWFNPRTGVSTAGTSLTGPGNQTIGNPPSETTADWVVLITADGGGTSSGNYVEQNGLVIMEAENTSSDLDLWIQKTAVSGYTGTSYIEFTGNTPISGPAKSPLEYTFDVTTSGLYYLHLFVSRETVDSRTDVANDGYIRLDGEYGQGPNAGNTHGKDAPLANLKASTKFYGGNNNQFVWATGNRLDLGGHNNKRVAVYDLTAGESYTFTMHGRSQLFKVDRIVFRHTDVAAASAQDLSKGETL